MEVLALKVSIVGISILEGLTSGILVSKRLVQRIFGFDSRSKSRCSLNPKGQGFAPMFPSLGGLSKWLALPLLGSDVIAALPTKMPSPIFPHLICFRGRKVKPHLRPLLGGKKSNPSREIPLNKDGNPDKGDNFRILNLGVS